MPYGYYYRMFDPTYILVLIGVIISLWASAKVKTTYAKYSRVRSMSGMTGAQAAERILYSAGIYDVRIEHVRGDLTDHYDPRNRVLRLSDTVYGSTSVAAAKRNRCTSRFLVIPLLMSSWAICWNSSLGKATRQSSSQRVTMKLSPISSRNLAGKFSRPLGSME